MPVRSSVSVSYTHLLDIIRSFDYDILLEIASRWRGGMSDTVWKFFSLIGNAGAVWIVLAIVLLFFRKTRRAGAAMPVSYTHLDLPRCTGDKPPALQE